MEHDNDDYLFNKTRRPDTDTIEDLQARIRAILLDAGKEDHCKTCGITIYRVLTTNLSSTAYTLDGKNHANECKGKAG